MTDLPFKTYNEAIEYFGIGIPRHFFNSLAAIDIFCQKNGVDTLDALMEIFGILRIEGSEAMYQQTPIELFPFGSSGSDGIHYGFIIHTIGEQDYPSAEICPMDDDGAVVIGNDSQALMQNLLCDEISIDKFLPLIKELSLNPVAYDRPRYDKSGKTLRVTVNPKNGWKFIETLDGAGVFAEEKYFADYHDRKYDFLNRDKGIEQYESLAKDMFNQGFYASQLYYLKEMYWYEWTNYTLAKKYLNQMLQPYEKLNREHLFNKTKWVIDTFDKRYGN